MSILQIGGNRSLLDLKICITFFGSFNVLYSFAVLGSFIQISVTAFTMKGIENDPELIAEHASVFATTFTLGLLFLAKFIFDVVFVYAVVAEMSGIVKAYYIVCVVFFLPFSFLFFINVAFYTLQIVLIDVAYISMNVYVAFLCRSYCHSLSVSKAK